MKARKNAVRASALAAALLLGACGGSDDDGPTGGGAGDGVPGPNGGATVDPDDLSGPFAEYATAPGVARCSVDDVKARVDFDMRDYYVYADRVPSLSPAQFETPEEQMAALRVAPDTFSRVSDFADFEAQSAGRNVGFGFRLLEDGAGALRFGLVIGGSPAADAGLRRGDVLTAIDGRPVGELDAAGITAALRDTDEGRDLTFSVMRGGQALDIAVVKAEYVTDTVAGTIAFDTASGTRTGYLPISQFADSTADALDGAFGFLVEEGVRALVVDVRYNPGGLIFAANRLASHIAGPNVADATFVQFLFNDRYAAQANLAERFEDVDATLGLDRVVFIATAQSASSAELAINGLRPFIDVQVVGSRTFGKSFGSAPREYCGKAINAMTFITANAEGEGVAGGIEPDCAIEDAFEFPLGDPDDALSGAAYRLLGGGGCASDVQGSAPAAARVRAVPGPAPLWDDTPLTGGAIAAR